MAVYHKDVFFPKSLKNLVLGAVASLGGHYTPTPHAAERAEQKGVALPPVLPKWCEVIEATVERGQLQKFLVRFRVPDGPDLVMSLTTDGRALTVYPNGRTDRHCTLDRSKYATRLAA
jgi:hypothetical protein